MSNAFAFIVQARPCPTLGRPVHLRGSPIDYSPVLLLMPFGFHLAMDTLALKRVPLRKTTRTGSRSALAVSGFRLRARLGFSIPSFLFPAREALPPRLDTTLLIRAPEGLEPSRSTRCSAHTMPSADFYSAVRPPYEGLSRQSDTEQISWGNLSRLPCTISESTPRTLAGYGLRGKSPARPALTPHIRYLSIDPHV